MKVNQTLILMAICCIVNLVHAQDIHGGGSHDGTYWPGSGVTIWEDSPIGRVIYWPEGGEGRLTLTDEGIYYDIDCAEDPGRCKALLEGANGVTTPAIPDTPVDTPSDPGKGKKKKKKNSQQVEELIAEIPVGNGKSRVLFKTQEGKWVEIKDKNGWTQKIIQSL